MRFASILATVVVLGDRLHQHAMAYVAPSAFTRSVRISNAVSSKRVRCTRPLTMAVDPTHFLQNPLDFSLLLPNAFPSLLLASDAAESVTSSVSDAVSTVTSPAVDATTQAASSNGWFGFLTGPIEGLLKLIHGGFVAVGLDQDAWGISIVAMTVVIKLFTYPLTASQLQSTNKMQALQPTIKEIQAKYQSNPEVMNQKIAEVYQTNDVNPLAGCLPSLVQIPVFIGLYRAVLTLAKDNKLDEPFLWLPNLEGPTYGADPAHGSDWILKGWVDGVPSLGWDKTLAFLTIPVFLVLSQFVSMQLMQPPKSDDPNQPQPQNNIVLKLLPLMIGWFSLNVPAALGIYWVANNIITTAITLQIRSGFGGILPSPGAVMDAKPTSFTPAPMREKPAGFGNVSTNNTGGGGGTDSDEVRPITSPIDAEIVDSTDTKEDKGDGFVASTSKTPSKKRSGGKKKKRKN